jgi:hypothetical protein
MDGCRKRYNKTNLEHFIVWMQMESFQNFRKLWGKIPQELRADNYTLKVKNCNSV